MATYTHDFEIKAYGVEIEGEICFDHGQAPAFKTNAGETVTLEQHSRIQCLLEELTKFAHRFEIEKIEIVKKV